MAVATVAERYTTEAVLRRYASLFESLASAPQGRPAQSVATLPESRRDIERTGN